LDYFKKAILKPILLRGNLETAKDTPLKKEDSNLKKIEIKSEQPPKKVSFSDENQKIFRVEKMN